MTFKKLIGQLHLWLGLVTGLVVFIVSLTGCLYVFYDEITQLVYKDRLFTIVPADATRLPLIQLEEVASAAIPDGVSLSRIIIPKQHDRTVIFAFEKHNEHAYTYSGYVEFYKTVFVDPYSGRIVKVEDTKWEFFNVVFWLHISLLLGYDVGSAIVTGCTIIFIILLITGIVLWWPAKKERGYLWFAWRKTTKWKRMNYDLHRITGFYVFPIALLFSLTGLFWASSDFNSFARWLANGGTSTVEKELPPPDANVALPTSPLELIYQKTDSLAPTASYILIRPPFKPGFPYVVRAYIDHVNYKRIELYFDKFSARLVETISPETRDNGEKLAVLNYDLHVGSIGGITTKIIAFIVSLIIASLPITGFYVWWLKRKGKESPRHRSLP